MIRKIFFFAFIPVILLGCASMLTNTFGKAKIPSELDALSQSELIHEYYWAYPFGKQYVGFQGTSKEQYLRDILKRLSRFHQEWTRADIEEMIKKQADPFKFHPDWDQRIRNVINNKKIFIGMTKDQLLLSWKDPISVNRTISAKEIHEQWVYPHGRYVYLENDIVTAFQDESNPSS